MKGNELTRDTEEDPSEWGDDAYFCDTCDKPFRCPFYDIAKQFERTIFEGGDSFPEVEIVGSKSIGHFCSSECRDQGRVEILQRENVRPTYPGIGPIELCSRCAAPVDMTRFHLAYEESVLDGEWDQMTVIPIDPTVLAIVCNSCSAPPERLIAEVDFPLTS